MSPHSIRTSKPLPRHKSQRHARKLTVVVAVSAFTAGCVVTPHGAGPPPEREREPQRVDHRCKPPYTLDIGDINMDPNPVRDGQSIREFRTHFSSDRNGECKTTFKVFHKGTVVAWASADHLAPGRQSLTLQPSPNFKFDQTHPCFTVVANIAITDGPPDASKQKCAAKVAAFPFPLWKL